VPLIGDMKHISTEGRRRIAELESAARKFWFAFGAVLVIYTVVAVALFLHFNLDRRHISVSKPATIDWGQVDHGDVCLQSKVDPRSAYWTSGVCDE